MSTAPAAAAQPQPTAHPSSTGWYDEHPEEKLEPPGAPHEEDSIFETKHSSQRFANVLSHYRSTYPETVWKKILDLFPDRLHATERPFCIDIAVGSEGRAGVELAKRGFRVIGVEPDATLLARTFRYAQAHNTPIQLITAKVENSLLQDNVADMVTFMHGLHLVDPSRALQEAHRLLKPGGALVAAWNDRDLSSEFVLDLEHLFEQYNPQYNRHSKQRDLGQWGHKLEHGGLFAVKDYSVHPNPMTMKSALGLLDMLDCMSFVRAAHRGADRKAFNNEVRALVEAHFGRSQFELPLETKLFILRKVADPVAEPEDHAHSVFGV